MAAKKAKTPDPAPAPKDSPAPEEAPPQETPLQREFRRHHNRSVPLIAVETHDAAAVVKEIETVNYNGAGAPAILYWDASTGVLPVNDAGVGALALMFPQPPPQEGGEVGLEVLMNAGASQAPRPDTCKDALQLLTLCRRLPPVENVVDPGRQVTCPECKGNWKPGGSCQRCEGVGTVLQRSLLVEGRPGLPPRTVLITEGVLEASRAEQANPERAHAVAVAVAGLRDQFKRDGSCLVMCSVLPVLPLRLQDDVIVLEHALPTREELGEMVRRAYVWAEQPAPSEEAVGGGVEALVGIAKSPAENSLVLSMTNDGLNLARLQERKRQMLVQTDGIEIIESPMQFSEIVGVDAARRDLERWCARHQFAGVVLVDEAGDQLAGAASGESSGVSQGQHAELLTWMQRRIDENTITPVLYLGIPGTGKTALAQAVATRARCLLTKWNLQAMQSKWVGESGERTRMVLRRTDAMMQGKILFIFTTNSVRNISPQLMSRFQLGGRWHFDFPTPEAVTALWRLYRAKFGIPEGEADPVFDCPITAREVRECCRAACEKGITLAEAAETSIPYYWSGAEQVREFRAQAHNAYLDAHLGGRFQAPQGFRPRSDEDRREDAMAALLEQLQGGGRRKPDLSD